jgi:hypothetical protein
MTQEQQQKDCNKNCQHKNSIKKEAFLAPPGLDVIPELLKLAKTGVFNYFFKDAQLNELASRISALFAENAYLKKLVSLIPVPPDICVKQQEVTIGFGPEQGYKLTIPVLGKKDRLQLADQLFYAALELKRQEIEYDKQQQQQQLPFSE